MIAFAAGHHGGNEVSGAVVAEARGLIPGGAVVGACDVRDVMFEVVLLEAKRFGVDVERLGDE